jgi:hypothetical protein
MPAKKFPRPEPLIPTNADTAVMPMDETPERQLARLQAFPPVYYETSTKEFWFETGGEWAPIKKSELKSWHFTDLGLRDRPFWKFPGVTNFKELDWPLWNAQTNNKVKFAGSIAGHRKGIHVQGTARYLVTDECYPEIWTLAQQLRDGKLPKLPEPKWFIERCDELLPVVKLGAEETIDQAEWFKFWFGIGLESLLKSTFIQGHLVGLFGESGCGKSAMQQIISEVLGGREFNPMESWLEGGRFNSGLSGAEHWKIEDSEATIDQKTRGKIGAYMKQAIINVKYRIEKKGKDSLSLKLFRRNSFSGNLDPISMAAMPNINNGLEDKISMFLCGRANFGADVDEVTANIARELAQIRVYLLKNYCAAKVPDKWRLNRHGEVDRMKIRAWQHPELLEMLGAINPEAKLLQMIDETIFIDTSDDGKKRIWKKGFEGLASELEAQIKKEGKYSEAQLERVFPQISSCGTMLDYLSRSYANRVEKIKAGSSNSGKTIWRINPPAQKTTNPKESKYERTKRAARRQGARRRIDSGDLATGRRQGWPQVANAQRHVGARVSTRRLEGVGIHERAWPL